MPTVMASTKQAKLRLGPLSSDVLRAPGLLMAPAVSRVLFLIRYYFSSYSRIIYKAYGYFIAKFFVILRPETQNSVES